MKLYGAPQTRSFRILWMLEECNADYERILVDIRAGQQHSAAYRSVNPMGKVPALSDGTMNIAESGAICAFLAERFPDAELAPPVGDKDRGRYLHWLFFSGNCVEPSFLEKAIGFQPNSAASGWGSYQRVMAVIAEAIRTGPWILGDRFSGADIMIGTDLYFGSRTLGLIEQKPVFERYIQRCGSRPAFQRAEAFDRDWTSADQSMSE